jgi:hypothetical protein
MDIKNLELCALRQDRATEAIVEKLVGLPARFIKVFPIIAKKGTFLHMYMPGNVGVNIDYDFVSPYIMNGAFSLELKMKYLHALETGEKMKSGHKLLELFAELSDETKKVIRNKLKLITKKSKLHQDTTKYFTQEANIQFSWEVHKLLSNSNMAFERWRYIYEGGDSTWFAGYSELQESLNCRISELK